MGRPTAWLLNFESDLEFACNGAFTPSVALEKQLASFRRSHAARLLGARDVVVEKGSQHSAADYDVQAWCPTPSAVARLKHSGLCAPPAPALDVLARANSREFCASLAEHLPGALFSSSVDESMQHVASEMPPGGWLLKRNYGTSGKGQQRVAAGDLGDSLRYWLKASMAQGGVRIEPRVNIEQEFAIHGWIAEGGDLRVGEPCVQSCSEHGTWMETRAVRAGELLDGEGLAIRASAESVGRALIDIGYHGPYGVDSYRWRDADGDLRLQPCSEINARFTLGWGVGFPATDGRPWQR